MEHDAPRLLENFCVDIDGILCRDPTREENDDGPKYRELIRPSIRSVLRTEAGRPHPSLENYRARLPPGVRNTGSSRESCEDIRRP